VAIVVPLAVTVRLSNFVVVVAGAARPLLIGRRHPPLLLSAGFG